MMASNDGTDKLDDNMSVPQDGRNIVSKEENQVEEGSHGFGNTRKRKADKQNTNGDSEEKQKTKKVHWAYEKEFDEENESTVKNESNQKSKKSKKNTLETKSVTTEPTPALAATAQNSSLPTVEEVCSTFGLKDVNIQYSDDDYKNLTNYKFFTKRVRSILAKENPKVSLVNMMMLVAAKWRDFSSRKPFIEQAPTPPPPPPAINSKKKVMPTVEEVCTAFGLKDVQIKFNEAADDVDLTKYRFFAPHVRSLLIKENPNVPFAKMSMLVSAKWREFSSQKLALTKQTEPSVLPPSAPNPKNENALTVEEVCSKLGLKNVEIQYHEADHEDLANYKSFLQYVYPILSKENPKVPATSIFTIIGAKWREFCNHKSALTEQTPPSPPQSPTDDPAKEELPSVQEVCAKFGIEDVKIVYNEISDRNSSNYRSFTQHVRPILSKVNPQVPASRILMLVAAKWREFLSQNRLDETTESNENKENEEQNSASKPTRSQVAKQKTRVNDADEGKIEPRVTRARSVVVKKRKL